MPRFGSLLNLVGRVGEHFGIYKHLLSRQMTIVVFHRINDDLPEDGLTCSSGRFEDFCSFFQRNFRIVSLREQIRGVAGAAGMGGTLSITFDDGYLDNFEVAGPILRRLKIPATFFVTTGFIGSSKVAPWDACLPHPPEWMSWDHVRGLVAQGFDIGAHTVSHADLVATDDDQIRFELCESKRRLERELGIDVDLFADPFGRQSPIPKRLIDLVKEAGYSSCASCCGGTNRSGADPFSLNRIGVSDWFSSPYQFGAALMLGRC